MPACDQVKKEEALKAKAIKFTLSTIPYESKEAREQSFLWEEKANHFQFAHSILKDLDEDREKALKAWNRVLSTIEKESILGKLIDICIKYG